MGYLVVITGTQYGDEGKGKIVDYFGVHRKEPSLFARWQGGNNAGHTIEVAGKIYKQHYISAGVVTGKDILLGHDMVIHPGALIEEEIEPLKHKINWDPETQLFISDRAHVTLDQHIVEDGLIRRKQGKFSAGSTLRGISPTYADKALRLGIRFGDLLDHSRLEERLKILFDHKRLLFEDSTKEDFRAVKEPLVKWYGDLGKRIFEDGRVLDPKITADKYHELGVQLENNICDTTLHIHKEYNSDATIICEGAQGTGLDLTHGIYPYGTSSHPIVGAACTGLGISPKMVDYSIGVVKVFASRVGSGPLITELYKDNITKEQQDELAKLGKEFGTTTRRMRRILWLDGVQLEHAARVNGFDEIALTKLDSMPLFGKYSENLKIATAYINDKGERVTEAPPADWAGVDNWTAEYKFFPLWGNKTRKEWDNIVTEYIDGKDSIPKAMKNYVKHIANIMNVKDTILSLGPDREATISVPYNKL